MKKSLSILALPLLCLAAVNTFAADNDAPKTRAEVKQETRASGVAAPSRTTAETAPVDAVEKKGSAGARSRTDVKSETNAAVRSGELPKTGEAVAAEAGDQHNAPKKKRHHKHRHAAKSADPSTAPTGTASETMGK